MTEWQPIETAPELTDVLVCVTHNVPIFHEDQDEWETVQWVDAFCDGHWVNFPHLVWVPFPPTAWMPLPNPPKPKQEATL